MTGWLLSTWRLRFFDEDGRQREELYREGDGLHINDEGYRALTGIVRPALEELLAKKDMD